MVKEKWKRERNLIFYIFYSTWIWVSFRAIHVFLCRFRNRYSFHRVSQILSWKEDSLSWKKNQFQLFRKSLLLSHFSFWFRDAMTEFKSWKLKLYKVARFDVQNYYVGSGTSIDSWRRHTRIQAKMYLHDTPQWTNGHNTHLLARSYCGRRWMRNQQSTSLVPVHWKVLVLSEQLQWRETT